MYNRKFSLKIWAAIAAFFAVTAIVASCDPKDDPVVEGEGTEQDADIVAFTFDGIDGKATIDRTAQTVTAKTGETVNLTAVVAEFTLSKGATAKVGNTTQESGVTANNFSGPVTYKVTSGDGLTTNDWTVTVVIEKKPVEVVMQDMALTGTVYDTDGNPLGGVSVVTGTLSATTGSDGKFTFEKAGTVDRRAIIRFSKSEYFTLTRSGLKEDEMAIHAVLKRKGNTDASLQTSFNANEAQTLLVGGMKAQIPASALVKADGTLYSGSVTADMLYLDPNDNDFAETMPGGDLAAIRSDNSETQLISYGMTEMTLTDAAGNPLQLQDGASSELTFPIPAGMENNPPATIPLWSFDEERGIWTEEGEATLQGNVYVGSVTHFSWHNLDVPAERVTIKGKVSDCENNPVSYVKITVEQTSAVTNSKGEYSVFVPSNTPVTVKVKSEDYGNYSPEVSHNVPGKPGGSVVTQDIKLPCRTQEPSDESVFAIDKASVTYLMDDGEMIITFDNYGKRMRIDFNYGKDDHAVTIFDGLARLYTFGVAGFWMDYPYEGNSTEGLFGTFIYDEAFVSQIPGYTVLPNENIAGKSCKVFSYIDPDNSGCTYKAGTWNGLIMLAESSCEDVVMVATNVNLNVPANAFTKTMNIF